MSSTSSATDSKAPAAAAAKPAPQKRPFPGGKQGSRPAAPASKPQAPPAVAPPPLELPPAASSSSSSSSGSDGKEVKAEVAAAAPAVETKRSPHLATLSEELYKRMDGSKSSGYHVHWRHLKEQKQWKFVTPFPMSARPKDCDKLGIFGWRLLDEERRLRDAEKKGGNKPAAAAFDGYLRGVAYAWPPDATAPVPLIVDTDFGTIHSFDSDLHLGDLAGVGNDNRLYRQAHVHEAAVAVGLNLNAMPGNSSEVQEFTSAPLVYDKDIYECLAFLKHFSYLCMVAMLETPTIPAKLRDKMLETKSNLETMTTKAFAWTDPTLEAFLMNKDMSAGLVKKAFSKLGALRSSHHVAESATSQNLFQFPVLQDFKALPKQLAALFQAQATLPVPQKKDAQARSGEAKKPRTANWVYPNVPVYEPDKDGKLVEVPYPQRRFDLYNNVCVGYLSFTPMVGYMPANPFMPRLVTQSITLRSGYPRPQMLVPPPPPPTYQMSELGSGEQSMSMLRSVLQQSTQDSDNSNNKRARVDQGSDEYDH